MWSLFRAARTLSFALASATMAVAVNPAAAQTNGQGQNPYYFNNQTYSYGLQLPQVPQPNGQDEIRAADGTTCRSSMASNNAYLDVGGIGGQGADGSFDSGTVYGRLIVPLGTIPNRLDCSSLYNLEIERLRHELELVRSGLGGGVAESAAPAKKDKAWAENGWSNKGWKAEGKPGAANTGAAVAASVPAATVVPMRLQPAGSINQTNTNPLAADGVRRAPGETVEYLPWSKEPAQGARVLVSISAPKPPKNDNFFRD